MLFQQALVFAVFSAYDTECEFGIGIAESLPGRGGVELMHEILGAREGAVDDVNMMNFGASKEERKSDMPGCLGAGAEDSD